MKALDINEGGRSSNPGRTRLRKRDSSMTAIFIRIGVEKSVIPGTAYTLGETSQIGGMSDYRRFGRSVQSATEVNKYRDPTLNIGELNHCDVC
jgi:hypothetical protein